MPVGGGRAWPGFEIDHSEPKARVWRSRGRAAAHGHTKQPGRGHGPPTSAATRPTTHARAGPTPHRRFHKLCRASNRAATTHMSSCLPHARLNPGQNSPASMCLHPKRDKTLPARAKQPKFHVFGRAGGILSRTAPQSSSTGHVLSDHKLYARTFTHRLARPPATPSMGGRHTQGQRGLAAVPVGGGGAWPGFEIDHSEPLGSRVAISRAGRPRAHKAARPGPRLTLQP